MPLAKVNLSVALIAALTGYFIYGPVFAIGLASLSIALVLLWSMVSTNMVLSALKARRMTDASADNIIHRLFLSDAQKLRESAALFNTSFYLIDAHVPLAFSMGSARGSSQILVTSGLFKTLTRAEVSAVIGHEMGHIKAGDSVLNAMRLSLSLLVSRLHLHPVMRLLGFAIPKPTLLAGVLMRPDCKADAFSATLSHDVKILASALKKLERGVRAVQWSALDDLPFLAAVTVIDPFAAQENYDHPEHSETAHRVAELYRLELPEAA